MDDDLPLERLRGAVALAARIVMRHEKYAPILDRLAEELEARMKRGSPKDRAAAILAELEEI